MKEERVGEGGLDVDMDRRRRDGDAGKGGENSSGEDEGGVERAGRLIPPLECERERWVERLSGVTGRGPRR